MSYGEDETCRIVSPSYRPEKIEMKKQGFKRFIYFYFVWTTVLPTCMYLHCDLPGTPGGQKRALDPLELELQVHGSHHMCTETGPGPFTRVASVLNH